MLPEYKPFPSIPRLKRNCLITEKIDGTNAQVWISDDCSVVAAGSRNRWITPEDDNYGFAKWVAEHAEELKQLGPGSHYGEWWGAGIQRGYGLTKKRFSLFKTGTHRPECCGVVPVLYSGVYTDDCVTTWLNVLRSSGSQAAPGFMNPEGIVVWFSAARSLFKVTLDGDGHKGAKE